MADYYIYIKDEKLKKLIRIQRIVMWIPLLGSLAAIGMMQYILYKRHLEKLAKFDAVIIAVMAGLMGLYFLMRFAFNKILPAGADGLIYITSLVLVSYFAAYMGVQDEIKTVYELQEGIVELPAEEDAEKVAAARAARKAEAARIAERKREYKERRLAARKDKASLDTDEDESILPPVAEQAPFAKMIRDDAEKTLKAGLPMRTKNIAGHEDKTMRALKLYMTPEREGILSSIGTAVDLSLVWITDGGKERRTEVFYSRPVLRPGYACYFSLTVKRGGERNGMLFKLSEITRSRIFGARHKKYYQSEEIIKVISEYLE